MPFELPADFPASMYPLAWMVGSWQGEGIIEHPTRDQPLPFHQVVQIIHEGQDYLAYHSRMTRSDSGVLLAEESGFWRVPPTSQFPAAPDPAAQGGESSGHVGPGEATVEALVVHPTGIAEIYLGSARAGVVELATDVVARTSTATTYNAARRMYGQVDGDLLWVLEVAAQGHPMTSHSSARLSRTDASMTHVGAGEHDD